MRVAVEVGQSLPRKMGRKTTQEGLLNARDCTTKSAGMRQQQVRQACSWSTDQKKLGEAGGSDS